MGGLSIGRVALVNDPAAIRRVLMDNTQNYHKDWLQRRVLSAGLSNGLLTADGHQWRMQRRALAPLFARRTVISFTAAMIDVAAAMVERLKSRDGQIEDMAVEVTRVTLEVLEKTMFADGLGRSAEEIRVAMKHYFEAIGRLDPFDVLGLPAWCCGSAAGKCGRCFAFSKPRSIPLYRPDAGVSPRIRPACRAISSRYCSKREIRKPARA
jgi:cytochrome P450